MVHFTPRERVPLGYVRKSHIHTERERETYTNTYGISKEKTTAWSRREAAARRTLLETRVFLHRGGRHLSSSRESVLAAVCVRRRCMATATTFRAARRPYDREAQERQPRQTTRFVGRVQYDGTEYVGWQTQPSGRGVQDVLEARLSSLLGGRVYVAGSGRTDKGVHARDQVAMPLSPRLACPPLPPPAARASPALSREPCPPPSVLRSSTSRPLPRRVSARAARAARAAAREWRTSNWPPRSPQQTTRRWRPCSSGS